MSNIHFSPACFTKTGWVPMSPFGQSLSIGDICQVKQGVLRPLIPISEIISIKAEVSEPLTLDPNDWRLSQGVNQRFCEVEERQESEGYSQYWAKQVLHFHNTGSFVFHGNKPTCTLLKNWLQLKNDLTLQLTQNQYSFREAYIITGVAKVEDWAFALASNGEAELSLSASTTNTDYFHLFSHNTARVEQRKNIDFYERSSEKSMHFFKAKKLVTSAQMIDLYLPQLIENKQNLSVYWSQDNLMDLVINKDLSSVKNELLNIAQSHEFLTLEQELNELSRHDVAEEIKNRLIETMQKYELATIRTQLVKLTNELNSPDKIALYDWVDISLDDINQLKI